MCHIYNKHDSRNNYRDSYGYEIDNFAFWKGLLVGIPVSLIIYLIIFLLFI